MGNVGLIDLATETLIPLVEAARQLPRRRAGRATHVSTLHRWRSRGLRGARLEAVRIGGIWHTSSEALHRFFAQLSQTDSEPRPEVSAIGSEMAERDIQTESQLDALGL